MSFSDPQTLQLVLLVLAVLVLALQTIFVISGLKMASRAVRTLQEELEQYRSSVMPIILKTHEMLQTIAPNIENATRDLAEISKSLRTQTEDVQAAANDLIDRTRRQAGRVDGMLTAVFDRVERAGVFMADAVARPMRQLSGILASVKAVVEALRDTDFAHARPSRSAPPRYAEEEPYTAPNANGGAAQYRP